MNQKQTVIFNSVSKSKLAEAYEISMKTLKLWLDPIENEVGAYYGKVYQPKQIEFIVSRFGIPPKYREILLTVIDFDLSELQ